MTALAQERPACSKQIGLHGTVRVVAIAAVLDHGLVLPQVRPALFLVALIAVVVEGGLHQHGLAAAAVRVVAVRAGGLAFQYRVSRWQAKLSLLTSMAAGAVVQLALCGQHRISRGVAVMAAGAGEVFLLVDATQPEHLVFLLVAGQASAIGGLGGRCPFRAKAYVRWIAGGPALVILADTVTTDAAGSAAAFKIAVWCSKDGVDGLIGGVPVTHQATRLG